MKPQDERIKLTVKSLAAENATNRIFEKGLGTSIFDLESG
jgi:hypothetical protein